MSNDGSTDPNAQVYVGSSNLKRDNEYSSSYLEDSPNTRERLTKQEAFELGREIRAYALASDKPVTTNDIIAKFSKCKEGFARNKLNELVKQGKMKAEMLQGLKVFTRVRHQEITDTLSQSKGETEKESSPKEKELYEKALIIPNRLENSELQAAINCIDNKIKKIKGKIERGKIKIQDLEKAKLHLLEKEQD
ncbi:hypothetical protein [Picosynechococcus sp. PCC 73109]|uniref:hypothetical protein n=1 Tax=Picosynechococcus sp. PCC 73109 TaxID=374982 RepID=UPI000745874D|nr:hypothetical protein [Picosynechococcus sp. PCC 73109]AMA09389.1 hypothetical protein AWQ23_08700 [Picosynechococcus sp. PCC 73109]